MRQRRALLLDASCVWPGGHNARACRLFARIFESRGYTPRYLIPLHGAADFPGEDAAVERVLPYPYRRRYGHIDGLPVHDLDRHLDAIVERHRGDRGSRLANRLLLPGADRRLTHLLESALAPTLDRAALDAGDAIMLPTADLYASSVVLAWLARRPAAERPAVLLRFLCILETEGLFRSHQRLKTLLRRAAELQRSGYRVVVAAEIAPWASKLERRAGGALGVHLLPSPPEAPAAPVRPRDPQRLGLSLISLRRREQGSRRLQAILAALPDTARQRLDIVAQSPHPRTAKGDARIASLHALGARILPYLSEAELSAELAALDVTLLPYRPEDYAVRGSSMLFEAANQGHLVLASADCGFSAEVEDFGLGRLCGSEAEFTEAIALLLRAFADGHHPRTESEPAAARYNAHRRALAERAVDALER